MTIRSLMPAITAIAVVTMLASVPASAVVVAGTSDPWLAGMPNGSTASTEDSAPGQSPVLATGLPLLSGDALTFAATGSVNYVSSPSGLTPDGDPGYFTPHWAGPENGISDVVAPVTSLVGVFLDASQPDTSAAPGRIDFTTGLGTDYLTLSPLLKQVFFIGDGLTSGNVVQQVVVPTGATRLYLGTMDGYGWDNNYGAFDVTVRESGSNGVPEPGSLALLATGLPVLMGLRRRKS